jgi:L,D-transpeptidase ErfK/SrfK
LTDERPLVLMRGMTVIPVGNVQEQLHYRGFPLGEVDNIFGIRTELAVRQFQASVGLPETGIVDAATWRLLFGGTPLPHDACSEEPTASREYDSDEVGIAQAGLSIIINLSQRRLSLLRGGQETASYPVAIGKPATPTPVGEWRILNKAMNPGGVFGTRWMAFTTRGHGIHGTNQPQSIGSAVSNGCVRMYTPDVEALFAQVSVGVPVSVRSGVPGQQAVPGTYVVRSGDTLFTIAQRFGTSVAALRSVNGLTSDALSVGQVLVIPGGPATPPNMVSDYVVQPGDTLFLISRKFGTTVQAVMSANNLTTTALYVGQRLRIPGGPRSSTQSGVGLREYVVQPGDTLWAIAAAHGLSPGALISANSLNSDDIYPGQVLRIPLAE